MLTPSTFPTAKECANLDNTAFEAAYAEKYGQQLMGETYAAAAPKSSILIGMMATATAAIPAGMVMLAHDIIANPVGSMFQSTTGLVMGGITLGVCAIGLGKLFMDTKNHDANNSSFYTNEVSIMDKIAEGRPELADRIAARRAEKELLHKQELRSNNGSLLGPAAAGWIIGPG